MKHNSIVIIFSLALLFILSSVAYADNYRLIQSQTAGTTPIGYTGSFNQFAVSFNSTNTTNLTRVDVQLWYTTTPPTGTVVVDIYNQTSAGVVGSKIATSINSVAGSSLTTTQTYYQFYFTSVPIVLNKNYYISINVTPSSGSNNTITQVNTAGAVPQYALSRLDSGAWTLQGNWYYNYYIYDSGTNLNINLYNQSSGAFLSTLNTTIQFNNDTYIFSGNTTNGSLSTSGFYNSTMYTMNISAPGFLPTSYAFVYSPDNSTINLYLIPNTTSSQVIFNILKSDNTPLQNALVQIEQFSNGTMRTVFGRFTAVDGLVSFNQSVGTTYRVTVSASGYITQQFTSALIQSPYTIRLSSVNQFASQADAGTSILWTHTPADINVSSGLVTWSQYVTGLDATANITLNQIILTNMSGTILASNTTYTNGTVYLYYNTTPYENKTLYVQFSFQKNGFTQYSYTQVYSVFNGRYTGTIEEARAYALSALSSKERVFLAMFLTLCFALIISVYARGMANAVLSGIFFGGIGYVLALNPFLMAMFLVVLILIVVAFQ